VAIDQPVVIPENKVINETAGGPDDWADELASGRLTPEELKAKAEDLAANRRSLPARVKAVLELARDGELDHRAGQVKSAEARATVAITVADAIAHSLSAKPQNGWLGKLLPTDARLSNQALRAASQSHLTLGGLARDRGDLALAESEYNSALESARPIRDGELAVGVAMLELGHNCHLQGRDREAEDWLRQAHPLLVQQQGAAYVPLDTYLLGLTQIGLQRWDEALSTLQETESLYVQRNVSKGVLDSRLARTDILIRTGRISDAEQLARETDEMAKQLNEPRYMAQARWHLSRIKRAEKKTEEAIDLLNEAINLYEQAGDSWHRAQSLMVLAEVQQQVGRVDDADRSLDEATRINTQMKSPFLEADCKRARANLRLATGKLSDARHLLTEAIRMYADQGREDQVSLAKAQLENLPA
jgi:tetratricopeptide (TPR) repeat protein